MINKLYSLTEHTFSFKMIYSYVFKNKNFSSESSKTNFNLFCDLDNSSPHAHDMKNGKINPLRMPTQNFMNQNRRVQNRQTDEWSQLMNIFGAVFFLQNKCDWPAVIFFSWDKYWCDELLVFCKLQIKDF